MSDCEGYDFDNEEFIIETPSLTASILCRKPPQKSLKEFIRSIYSENSGGMEDQNSAPLKCINDASGSKQSKCKNIVEYLDYINNGGYYASPFGVFLVEIGTNLVSEFVYSDIAKSGDISELDSHDINLSSTLKEECERFDRMYPQSRIIMKICKHCQFQTESSLILSFHRETPHKVNNAYKCNICSFKVGSMHVYRHHMKTEHNIATKSERPLAKQCIFCPYENTSSEKVEIHNLHCRNKLRLDSILKPDDDWDPPAKINRFDARASYLDDNPPKKRFSFTSGSQQTETTCKPLITEPTISAVPLAHVPQESCENSGLPIRLSNKNKQKSKPTETSIGHIKEHIYSLPSENRAEKIPSPSAVLKCIQPLSVVSNLTLKRKVTPKNKINDLNMKDAEMMRPNDTLHDNNNRRQIVLKQQTVTPSSVRKRYSILDHMKCKSEERFPEIHEEIIKVNNQAPKKMLSKRLRVKNVNEEIVNLDVALCELCYRDCDDSKDLFAHFKSKHSSEIFFVSAAGKPCSICKEFFYTDKGLERHSLFAHGIISKELKAAAAKKKDSGICRICKLNSTAILKHMQMFHRTVFKSAKEIK